MTSAKYDNMPKDILVLLQESEKKKLEGQHQEAVFLAEKALSIDPVCIEALEEIADNYLALNKIKKAYEAASFAYELNYNSYTALYILGFIESRKSNFKKAIKYLEQSNELKPNNSEILRALGWAYFMENKRVKGIVILKRALNLNNEDTMILCDLGICYIKENNPNKALELFYRAIELNPNDKRIQECIRIAEEVKGLQSTNLNSN